MKLIKDTGVIDVKHSAEQKEKANRMINAMLVLLRETGLSVKVQGMGVFMAEKNLDTAGIVQREFIGNYGPTRVFISVEHPKTNPEVEE